VLLHDGGRMIEVGDGLPNRETNSLAARRGLWRETHR
jgi:hypothetical protein